MKGRAEADRLIHFLHHKKQSSGRPLGAHLDWHHGVYFVSVLLYIWGWVGGSMIKIGYEHDQIIAISLG